MIGEMQAICLKELVNDWRGEMQAICLRELADDWRDASYLSEGISR